MGTNYYWTKKACEHCGRSDEPLHIGKSSAGWCFSLHVDEDRGIIDLPDWWGLWKQDGTKITDEYGREVTPEEMLAVVLARFGRRGSAAGPKAEMEINGAVEGPYGLWRHKLGRGCIGHGTGTYDLITGEFS